MPTPEEIETYSQGSCHIFAAACVLSHGGSFLVASDNGSTHFENEDGDCVDEVIHVYAKIPVNGGHVYRDVFGDRTVLENEGMTSLREEIAERFQVWEQDITLTDMTVDEMNEIVQDENGCFAETFKSSDECAIIVDHDDRPLEEMCAQSLREARGLPEVHALPGSLPLISVVTPESDLAL